MAVQVVLKEIRAGQYGGYQYVPQKNKRKQTNELQITKSNIY